MSAIFGCDMLETREAARALIEDAQALERVQGKRPVKERPIDLTNEIGNLRVLVEHGLHAWIEDAHCEKA